VDGRSVLISGAGIAGPTLAYWLGRHGFRPTLVERAPVPRVGGYIIDFWGLGYDVAERMGLVAGLHTRGYDIKALRFVDAHGARLGGIDAGVFRSLAGGRYVSLARGDLAALIYDTIAGRYETLFNDSIAGIEQTGDSVAVAFVHATPRRFDLVVGADGLHSVVRELVFGREDQFERYFHYRVAAFAAHGYRPRDEDIYVSYGVPGKQVARFAMRGDRTVFLFVFATDDSDPIVPDTIAAHRGAVHAAFDDAGWECPRILAALDTCDELYFDRVSQIRMDAWSRGRVALIGDAAFCPSLLAGQGSAFAVIAAYVLAGELARSGGRPVEAFQRYERLLRPFIAGKQRAAEGFARSFAPMTRLGLTFRNQVTRAFAIPGLARLALGGSVRDRLDLPDYGSPTGPG
jgi:2-polyprenyl-6-methoxyphenol hydroxylase-like FAD-dependent oxidoreductase